MKKFKDFVYDYNDVLLAILIILIAGAVIFWKVTDIMAYPSYAKAQTKQSQDVTITDKDLEPIDVDPIQAPGEDIETGANPEIDNQQPQENQQPQQQPTQKPAGETKFEVKQGEYFSTAAKKLKEAGLIEDSQKFIEKVKSMGLENKLQIGTFTIPAGATDEEIAKIITKTK